MWTYEIIFELASFQISNTVNSQVQHTGADSGRMSQQEQLDCVLQLVFFYNLPLLHRKQVLHIFSFIKSIITNTWSGQNINKKQQFHFEAFRCHWFDDRKFGNFYDSFPRHRRAAGNDRSRAARSKIEMDAVISFVEKKSFGFLQQQLQGTAFEKFLFPLMTFCFGHLGCTNCRAKKLRFNLTFLSAFDSPLSPSTSWSDFRDRTPRPTRVLPLWRCSSLSSFNFHCTISRLCFKQTFFHFRDANSPFSMILSTQTPIHG